MGFSKSYPENDSYDKVRVLGGVLLSLLFISVAVFTSGCVTTNGSIAVETTPVDIPSDMAAAVLDLTTAIQRIDSAVRTDVSGLAERIGAATSDHEIESIALEYYSENLWVNKLIYYNATREKYIEVPLRLDMQTMKNLPQVKESELRDVGGILYLDCVYIPGEGFVELTYVAVYEKDGTYKGYFILIYEYYVALTWHPVANNRETSSYDNYVCYITDENDVIIHASKQEYIGETIAADVPTRTFESILSRPETPAGAYQYRSQAFYNYDKNVSTEKITSWQKFTVHNSTYTMYLTKELNQPEIIYGDILTPDIAGMTDDVIAMYLYASEFGNDAALKHMKEITSTSMYAVNMDGVILSASKNETMLIGLSFLNNHGAYGVSYMDQMIYTARHGGGYVYYLYPFDGTIHTRAGQFCIGYVMPLDNDMFVVGYTFGDSKISRINYDIRSDITAVARAVAEEAYADGIDVVISRIRENPGGDGRLFVPGLGTEVKDIGVADYNGYSYASLYNATFAGRSETRYVDAYGGSTARRGLLLAKSGGGFINDLSVNPENDEYLDWWVYCVEPIDNTYVIYAGACIGTYRNYLFPYLMESSTA